MNCDDPVGGGNGSRLIALTSTDEPWMHLACIPRCRQLLMKVTDDGPPGIVVGWRRQARCQRGRPLVELGGTRTFYLTYGGWGLVGTTPTLHERRPILTKIPGNGFWLSSLWRSARRWRAPCTVMKTAMMPREGWSSPFLLFVVGAVLAMWIVNPRGRSEPPGSG